MVGAHLSSRAYDGYVIAALRGELDVLDANSLVTALGTLATGGPIILDLEYLDFIDCRGLSALVLGQRQARHAGGELVLAAPQRHVLRILTATGMIGAFSIHPSVEDALRITQASKQQASEQRS